jgi:hypothetical protein
MLTMSIYFVSLSGGNNIWLFICHSLKTSRVEILLRAYRPNSNKTQSLYNYLLNHTTLIIRNLQFTLHQLLTNHCTTDNTKQLTTRLPTNSGQNQSQSHITIDNQPASPSWCQAPIWDPRPIFLSPWDFLLDSYCLLFCSALSDERTGLQFTVATGPRQRTSTRVWPLLREGGFVFCVVCQYQSIVSQHVRKVFTWDIYITCVWHSSGMYIQYIQGAAS